MKTKKFFFVLAGICLLFFVTGLAVAGPPSAKFAATWSTKPGVASVAYVPWTTTDAIDLDRNMGYTLTKIKVPQDKELLVGLSAEVGLVTDTSVKGKEGGAAKAIAGGKANVTIFAIPEPFYPEGVRKAKPGRIMLSARFQELNATLGGVLQSCIDTGEYVVDEAGVCTETTYDFCGGTADAGDVSCPDGVVTIPCECIFTDEEIGFLQRTLAAHHFNFLFPDMDQGVYKIVAFFTTGAIAEVDICDSAEDWCSDGTGYDPDGTASASSYARAIIGKTMLTVQQVRAAKDSLNKMDIIEP
jgi:hypothetical protein